MKIYKKAGLVAERPHLNLPTGTYEEEIGLQGFFGPVAHLYHRRPPTGWTDIKKADFQWPSDNETKSEFLKPECYRPAEAAKGDFFSTGRKLFWNADIAVWIHTPTEGSKSFFRNADGSDLFFCHQGSAMLESPFGQLEIKSGDYVYVPKGVTYRLEPSSSTYLLRVESLTSELKKPETGILGQQALYHEEGIIGPQFGNSKSSARRESTVLVQKDGEFTKITYDFDICDIAGWMGTLYPYKLSVNSIAPVLSSVAHLPPSINATFMAKTFIVCTFLPRPLEEPEGALKVPFYHSNIDYDEVIFYHEGDFFSRDGMSKGSVTLHPRGVNHGPHPKALLNQNKKTRTDEIAVMIDTEKPLKVSKWARGLENADYWKSWMKKD